MKSLFLLTTSFLASSAGAVTGIGGGVIMKPAIDLFSLLAVDTSNFLCGLTVLCMSFVSICKNREIKTEKARIIPLIAGSVAGGISGKILFELMISRMEEVTKTGAVQALVLAALTVFVLFYVLLEKHIKTLSVSNPFVCIALGLTLGLMSSFLGIGGGPINLLVFYYFFSSDIKTAAKTSLSVIFFSQLAGLLYLLISGNLPEFIWLDMLAMVIGGIGGGFVGGYILKRISDKYASVLFKALLFIIIAICVFNFIRLK